MLAFFRYKLANILFKPLQRAGMAGILGAIPEGFQNAPIDGALESGPREELVELCPVQQQHVRAGEIAFADFALRVERFRLHKQRQRRQLDGAKVDVNPEDIVRRNRARDLFLGCDRRLFRPPGFPSMAHFFSVHLREQVERDQPEVQGSAGGIE